MKFQGKAKKDRIEDHLLRLRDVSKALMHQLNIGAASPDIVVQGAPPAAEAIPRRERVQTKEGIDCWYVHEFAELPSEEQAFENELCDVWIKSCGWSGHGAVQTEKFIGDFIIITGDSRFVCIESCTNMRIAIDNIAMGILIKDCSNTVLFVGGDIPVPPITLESCVGVEIVMGPRSMDHAIESFDSTGCMISHVPGPFDDVQSQILMQTEHREPTIIPERQITTLQLGSMVTIANTKAVRENKALLALAENENFIGLHMPPEIIEMNPYAPPKK